MHGELEGFNPAEQDKMKEKREIKRMEAPNDQNYAYEVIYGPDEDGNNDTFLEFPDLPGCMTQISPDADVEQAASEILTLWVESEMQQGNSIPEPQFNS